MKDGYIEIHEDELKPNGTANERARRNPPHDHQDKDRLRRGGRNRVPNRI